MRVFNLAEELEKERKKSKILEENNKLLIQQKAKMYEDLDKLSNRIDKVIKYIEEARESDSCTRLPSGKITDIGYCLEAFEDIEDLLNGKELKGE